MHVFNQIYICTISKIAFLLSHFIHFYSKNVENLHYIVCIQKSTVYVLIFVSINFRELQCTQEKFSQIFIFAGQICNISI